MKYPQSFIAINYERNVLLVISGKEVSCRNIVKHNMTVAGRKHFSF